MGRRVERMCTGENKLELVAETHFFSPAVQFNTTVMGSGDGSPI